MAERNRPTPEGRALGNQLARLADHADAVLRAKETDVPERCASCAFRGGTFPNGCAETLMDALKCVMEGEPFFCHESKHERVLCAGWFISRAELGDAPKLETPWPFSHQSSAPPQESKP